MVTPTEAPAEAPRLTARDKVRRLAFALVVLACLGLLAAGVAAVREVDANGDVIEDRDDPNDVEITGDDDLVSQQPPGAAGGGPATAEIVEQTIPAEGAEILQQQQIGIDLGDEYRVTRLLIDRTLIEEDHLIRRDELSQVFFQPSEGYEFEAFPAGRVCAVAEVERAATGEPVRSVEWCFEVT
jgi:hypothetical protein